MNPGKFFKDLFVVEDEEEFDNEVIDNEEEIKEPEIKVSSNTLKDTLNKKEKIMGIRSTAQLQIVLVKPEGFEDASSIADHLKNKSSVLLNLEDTSKELSRRLVDFLSGVAYANNGKIKRVANRTFMITPFDVDIKSDGVLEELEDSIGYIEQC